MQPLDRELTSEEEHPSVQELVAFLRGEAPRDTVKHVVRHLMANCPQCLRVTRRYWQIAEKPYALELLIREEAARRAGTDPRRGRPSEPRRDPGHASASTRIAAARGKLREAVRTLEGIRTLLQEVQANLKMPAVDLDRLLAKGEEDIEIELRSVIVCVLADSIGPAIRDLHDVAVYGLAQEEEGETGAQENASGEGTE